MNTTRKTKSSRVARKGHLDPSLARKLSDLGHLAFIEAITTASPLMARQYAFHGGTSLHLSWRSPRFSEDLDFLLDRNLKPKMGSVISKIEARMRAILRDHDPHLDVKITDKTKGDANLLNYRITVNSAEYMGNVHVKAEFWQVDSDYLRHYDTRFAYPLNNGDLITSMPQPMPAATLEAAYADKLTAFATRRFLKWRDVFDLWWIGERIDLDKNEMAERFLHHVTAFDTNEGLSPAAALRRFLERSEEDILRDADPDIKKWLPKDLWERLEGQGVERIVKDVRRRIAEIAAVVEQAAEVSVEESENAQEEDSLSL